MIIKRTLISRLFAAVAVLGLVASPLTGQSVTIDVTKVQQRYPWNGLVDIDYTIMRSEGEGAYNPDLYCVEFTVVNHGVTPAVTNVAKEFRNGNPTVSDGGHRVTWDANADGVDFASESVEVVAEIVHYERTYMVIDLSGGPSATVYPVTYLSEPPAGGFNIEKYKGDKIVLRMVQPGSFLMGSPTTEPGRSDTADREVQHAVSITKPFYIGIFQVTQKQYKNVMANADPSKFKGPYRPVEQVSYNTVRGSAQWPQANSVGASSFIGVLRAKCKEWDSDKRAYAKDLGWVFDLPTEAQWEYACRAGTTTPFNNGVSCANDEDLDIQLGKLGCYNYDQSYGEGFQHAIVGSYESNAWGLYDMHGNVWELCLDWYRADVQNIDNPSVDPVGPATGTVRVRRGGSWLDGVSRNCRSAMRNSIDPGNAGGSNVGFRLSMSLP